MAFAGSLWPNFAIIAAVLTTGQIHFFTSALFLHYVIYSLIDKFCRFILRNTCNPDVSAEQLFRVYQRIELPVIFVKIRHMIRRRINRLDSYYLDIRYRYT